MKTCLKRSEIIKQLKRFFFGPSVSLDLYRVADVPVSHFDRYYFCIVSFSNKFQVVTIHLLFGWVCVVIQGCYDNMADAQHEYLETMHRYINESIETFGLYERDFKTF